MTWSGGGNGGVNWDPAYSPTRLPGGSEHLMYGELIPGEFSGGDYADRLGGGMSGSMSGGEYQNFAINSNVCLCEDNVGM